MPQMSPLMWLFLMIMVVVSYGLFTAVNYFIVQSPEIKETSDMHQVVFKNWRW